MATKEDYKEYAPLHNGVVKGRDLFFKSYKDIWEKVTNYIWREEHVEWPTRGVNGHNRDPLPELPAFKLSRLPKIEQEVYNVLKANEQSFELVLEELNTECPQDNGDKSTAVLVRRVDVRLGLALQYSISIELDLRRKGPFGPNGHRLGSEDRAGMGMGDMPLRARQKLPPDHDQAHMAGLAPKAPWGKYKIQAPSYMSPHPGTQRGRRVSQPAPEAKSEFKTMVLIFPVDYDPIAVHGFYLKEHDKAKRDNEGWLADRGNTLPDTTAYLRDLMLRVYAQYGVRNIWLTNYKRWVGLRLKGDIIDTPCKWPYDRYGRPRVAFQVGTSQENQPARIDPPALEIEVEFGAEKQEHKAHARRMWYNSLKISRDDVLEDM